MITTTNKETDVLAAIGLAVDRCVARNAIYVPTPSELAAMRNRDSMQSSAMDYLLNEGYDQSETPDNTPYHKPDFY